MTRKGIQAGVICRLIANGWPLELHAGPQHRFTVAGCTPETEYAVVDFCTDRCILGQRLAWASSARSQCGVVELSNRRMPISRR